MADSVVMHASVGIASVGDKVVQVTGYGLTPEEASTDFYRRVQILRSEVSKEASDA